MDNSVLVEEEGSCDDKESLHVELWASLDSLAGSDEDVAEDDTLEPWEGLLDVSRAELVDSSSLELVEKLVDTSLLMLVELDSSALLVTTIELVESVEDSTSSLDVLESTIGLDVVWVEVPGDSVED